MPSIAWTREITPPWRRGGGLAFPFVGKRLVTVGIWWRGKAPFEDVVGRDVDIEVLRSW